MTCGYEMFIAFISGFSLGMVAVYIAMDLVIRKHLIKQKKE